MATIRLRKVDLEMLAEVDTHVTCEAGTLSAKQIKGWSAFYERVMAAEIKPACVLSVKAAIESFRGVLGGRLVLPAGNPGAGWFSQMQKRINSSGLTVPLCLEAARLAGLEWKGPIKAESIIRQADVLLSEAGWGGSARTAPPEREDMVEL